MAALRFESLYPQNSREAEIAKILDFVRAGFSCQVIGLPGVGRSNLLGLLAFNRNVRLKHLGENQKKFHFVYLNFAEVKEADPAQLNKFLFLRLIESLEERSYQEALNKIKSLFDEALSKNEPLILWQNLKRAVDLLANTEGLSLGFLLDRFEEYRKVTGEFFLNLRSFRSLAKYRFAAIFALSQPLEKTQETSIYKEFYEFFIGHNIYLPIWDKPGTEFRLSYLENVSQKKLDPKIKESLLSLTGGHGKLTKIGAEAILNAEKVDHLKDFLASQAAIQGALHEIWHSLIPKERELVRKIAQKLKPDYPPDHTPAYAEDLEFLKNLDLIKKDGSSWSLTIPLLTDYLELIPQDEEKIYYRPETNEILKGERVISDDLTAQEFRLLKFLLENPGRVYEREEIIRSVWPEAKSTQGISDEAIDQMVFRLRKKTETDTKNPKKLQTVKGRGFRFNP